MSTTFNFWFLQKLLPSYSRSSWISKGEPFGAVWDRCSRIFYKPDTILVA